MQDASPAVAILPPHVKPGLRLGAVSLDQLTWPLGQPQRLMKGRVRDLAPDDHLIGFPQNLFIRYPGLGTGAKISVLLAEPTAIHGTYQRKIQRRAQKFHRILSYNEALLASVPNGIFFPYGASTVEGWRDQNLKKTEMCSLIASAKRSQEGHMLRHKIAEYAVSKQLDVAVVGRGYKPFERKEEGLAAFRYSVVIENGREPHYFTEKLIDAMLCRTVPIYWGCPNIQDFMDVSGMILCETEDDIKRALSNMSEEDYSIRLPGLQSALPAAEAYSDILTRAAKAVMQDGTEPSFELRYQV